MDILKTVLTIILMIFNFIKSISEFLASILIIICAVKYLKKH